MSANRRYLRYTVYQCADNGGDAECERLATYIDGAAALARAVWIARRGGGYAEIVVYQAEAGSHG